MLSKPRLLLTITCAMTISGCISHSSLPSDQRPAAWADDVAHSRTDLNLHQISPLLYRSAQPELADIATLQALGIDTIIDLRTSDKSNTLAHNSKLQVIDIPINTWEINKHDVLQTMQAIKSAQAQGRISLIHCYHGSDRTGTMAAMYRILFENWTIAQAKEEMKYGGYGYHPIWINIDRLFTDSNIAWLKAELAKSSD